MEVLLQLTWSQGLGAAGDVVGQRCARVVYDGSWDRMVLATSAVGVVAALALASGLSMAALVGSDVPQIRTWMLLTNPALMFMNGTLAVGYSIAEAQLFTYSTGPMLKGVASLVSPVLILACQQQLASIGILGDVSAKGPFVGWQTSFAFGLLGAVCFLAPKWRRSCPDGLKLDTCLDRVSDSKASDARAIIPFTAMLVCYAAWNIVQRFSFVNFRVNQLEWLFLDKGIGGSWYLLYLVMQDSVAGRTTDYKRCMQESSRGAPWVVLFLLMQFIRIAVSFLVVGSDKSKITVSTASMMLAVARVAAVALVSSAVACIAPNFVGLTAADRHTRGDCVLSLLGYAMVIGSFANWFSTVQTAGDIGPPDVAFLAVGDWGCPISRDVDPWSDGAKSQFACATPQSDVALMIKNRINAQDLTHPAFVLNLGDSFYPRGVTSAADLYNRAAIHAKLYGNGNSDDIPWYSILGNHDSLGNISVVVPGEHKLLKYPARYYQWQQHLSRQRSVQFIALDTTVVNAASICGKKEPKHGVDACIHEMELRWKEQLLWLTATLENSQATWRVVFGHNPVFGTGRWAFNGADPTFLRDALVPLLTGFNVSLYLSGHDHLSQLMEHRGVLYGIFGATGGSELDRDEFQGALRVPQEVQVLTTVAAFGLGTINIGDTPHGEGICITISSLSPLSRTHVHCLTQPLGSGTLTV